MSNNREIINEIANKFPKLVRQEQNAAEKAAGAVGLQLLNFCANGSPNESVQPPIDTGYLRGSGSVFVNGKHISSTPPVNGQGEPLESFSTSIIDNEYAIDIIYNTEYAARMHEGDWIPGGKVPSKASKNNPAILQNVGNKWIEKHLLADGEDLIMLFGNRMFKYFFSRG
jgi:hypothetical protein